jgi:hypothetical protein
MPDVNHSTAATLIIDSGNDRDTTPQQDSLSGVIICPAYWIGQRLRANSFATTNTLISNHKAWVVKESAFLAVLDEIGPRVHLVS